MISISKENLAQLPLVTFDGRITVVDTPAVARQAVRALSKCPVVGFDTETRPSFRKGCVHPVALMQISTGEHCFLFRLNKTGVTQPIKEFLENAEITKIGLSLHDDFHALDRTTPITPRGFIDLQQMVRQFDIADISLQKIYAILFGGRISKAQRLTNWEADTLSPAQQTYAAIDAWACLKIYEYLKCGAFDHTKCPYQTTQQQ